MSFIEHGKVCNSVGALTPPMKGVWITFNLVVLIFSGGSELFKDWSVSFLNDVGNKRMHLLWNFFRAFSH